MAKLKTKLDINFTIFS